ncbi:MAG: chorismate mutase [Clostridia bacterium]|nr:chorismate mutase [Clostridia bacterium]
MKSLTDLREELDGVDREIVRLFEKRMNIACDVARYKMANGLPVLDRSREEQVLQSRAALTEDPAWGPSVRQLYEAIMALSRDAQTRLMEQRKEE